MAHFPFLSFLSLAVEPLFATSAAIARTRSATCAARPNQEQPKTPEAARNGTANTTPSHRPQASPNTAHASRYARNHCVLCLTIPFPLQLLITFNCPLQLPLLCNYLSLSSIYPFQFPTLIAIYPFLTLGEHFSVIRNFRTETSLDQFE